MSAPNEQIDWGNWIYRLVALVIDSVITGIPAGIIYVVISAAIWTTTLPYGIVYDATPIWAGFTLLPFLYGIFLVLYSAILEVVWGGQTLGKKILNLKVQSVRGERLEFGKTFIRNITKIYGLLLLLDWLLGIVTPGNKNQRYFDQLTGTVVTRGGFSTAAPPPPPPPPPA